MCRRQDFLKERVAKIKLKYKFYLIIFAYQIIIWKRIINKKVPSQEKKKDCQNINEQITDDFFYLSLF